MDSPLITPDSAQRTDLATCACGGPRARGEHRMCAGAAAVHHSVRVTEQADQLLNRLRAIVLMGTLDGELRPLSA
ncbi:hypothetical protein [Pedococcus dokdonensis]|uniref:hypothetical protein n=1 Tax=Pedococcus dokdonensis TaxID=443156 RepID=UPI0012FDB262|nr:hypothetical protein [Pedococcus dokdonensis]